MSCVKCHVSGVKCHVSTVTCHLSPTPTATSTDPPPANSPIMHSRLVSKEPIFFFYQQKYGNSKNQKISRGMPILVIRSSTRSLQSTGKPTQLKENYSFLIGVILSISRYFGFKIFNRFSFHLTFLQKQCNGCRCRSKEQQLVYLVKLSQKTRGSVGLYQLRYSHADAYSQPT